jgi:DNA polymerase I
MKKEPRPFLPRDVVCVDYETSDLSSRIGKIFAASFTWVEDGYTEVWRESGAVRFYDGDEREVARCTSDFRKRLAEFWASPCAAVAHNLKFEYHFTLSGLYAINPRKPLHDTMIMSQYVDNLCPSHALDYLFNRFHGKVDWITEADKNVSKAAKIYGSYDKIPDELMFPYQLADGIRGALLYKMFWPLVIPASEYWNEIELIKTTVDMERRGFMIDRKQAQTLIAWMQSELAQNEIATRRIVGRYINLLSEKQLKQLLFDELKFPRMDSTDKNAILKIKHPVIDCVQKARAYTKGVAIVKGYLQETDKEGLIHPNIRTNRAGTGRESSENPNVQNISKEIKAGAVYTVPARRCFRARPGFILLLADYAGIEMRLAVQGTGDSRLLTMCNNGYDFHASCARTFYGDVYEKEIDADLKAALRSRAKNARFAMLYGAGLEQTAATLGLTVEETRAGYERDKTDFPEFYALMDKCTHDAKHDGFITTFFGRKLRVPLDRPYAATDYLIQGSAAALFKHAQNAVHFFFKIHHPNDCFIIIPVHDELVMEVRRGVCLPILMDQIKQRMSSRPEITVKLDVDFSIATYTWDKKVSYSLKE